MLYSHQINTILKTKTIDSPFWIELMQSCEIPLINVKERNKHFCRHCFFRLHTSMLTSNWKLAKPFLHHFEIESIYYGRHMERKWSVDVIIWMICHGEHIIIYESNESKCCIFSNNHCDSHVLWLHILCRKQNSSLYSWRKIN